MKVNPAAAILLLIVLAVCGCGQKEPSTLSPTSEVLAATPATPASTSQELPVSPKFHDALKARMGDEFAVVVLADGHKTIVPLGSLPPGDRAWLSKLAERSPFTTSGKSSVVVVEDTDPRNQPKNTIEVSKIEGSLETVQLCAPNVIHDQIGGTCMLYARVHWLDIAGYYVDRTTIFKIINDTPPEHPWTDPKYVAGLESIMTGFKHETITHPIPPGVEPFEWAREELRQGRPLLAALPREIWVALPVEYLADRIWSGGSVGHQIVVNGFTWDSEARKGTFHVVNSWNELMEFDLSTRDASDGILVFEASLSPLGEAALENEREPLPARPKPVVENVTLLKKVGVANLYKVTTQSRVYKIVAPDADAARRMIEEGS